MVQVRISIWIGLLCGSLVGIQGAEPPGPEWQVLQSLVGKWEGDYTVGTGSKATSRSENESILDGRFVRSNVESVDPRGNVLRTMIVWGYDAGLKKYTRSFFFSSGGAFHETGTFDPGTKSFTFSGELDLKSGQARTATVQQSGPDTLRWQILLPTQPGQPPVVVVGVNRRVK